MNNTLTFDVIVIGAGHAGCEAAVASAKLGSRTCLITMDMNKIAQMSCNPASGGIAKGQIVREIDALGGQIGIITDETTIQFKMLNRSKGPAMWSPRAQCDRMKYSEKWRSVIEKTPNLYIWQDQAEELIVENEKAIGIRTIWNTSIYAKSIIITTGTFLNGLMHIGRNKVAGGRVSEPASLNFSESITKWGITSGRMKTGTPVRIDARSVHFEEMEKQEGENNYYSFSYLNKPKELKQLPCWTCYTNKEVHETLRKGLKDSPLYNGQIKSIGPRYCPSIETKLETFPDKDKHPLFLEPEGEETNEMYLNGFSSSLPMEIQIEALKKVPCFRDLIVYRPGYAIEYDFFDPRDLKHSLESKKIDSLFFAGQVNGTTGYEEAAGQGLIAGINASLKAQNKEAFILKRDEAYIGVLIDDLVTKGVDEPYRMFTSRAEYRILLRQDNADQRLTEKGHELGLVSEERYNIYRCKEEKINKLVDFCEKCHIKPSEVNQILDKMETTHLREGCKLSDLITRPQISIIKMEEELTKFKRFTNELFASEKDGNQSESEIKEAAEIRIKYKGYIERERELAEKAKRLEDIRIKDRFEYDSITQLSTEARQKLKRINPETLAQASRIPGISPSDINVLLVLLRR